MKKTNRIFVGIDLSQKFTSVIPMLSTTVLDSENNIKWISGKSLHLTLSFLGNLETSEINSLIIDLKELTEFSRISFNVEGTGIFNNKESRVFWLGTGKGTDQLLNLQKFIDNITKSYISQSKIRLFKPHITIGRINMQKKISNFDVSTFLNTVYSPIRISVKSVHLFKSSMTDNGIKYSVLSSFSLS